MAKLIIENNTLINDLLTKHGFKKTDEVSDQGISGAKSDRPIDLTGAHVYNGHSSLASGYEIHVHPERGHWKIFRHANGAGYASGQDSKSLETHLNLAIKLGSHMNAGMSGWGKKK